MTQEKVNIRDIIYLSSMLIIEGVPIWYFNQDTSKMFGVILIYLFLIPVIIIIFKK